VPVAPARPPDQLAGTNRLPRLDERVDVAIPEMADAREPADTMGGRLVHAATFDRVDAMRPARRRALLRAVVAHGHVNALVVDRSAATVWPRIEEGAADRVRRLSGSTGQPLHPSL
jgi:hypothetical protein